MHIHNTSPSALKIHWNRKATGSIICSWYCGEGVQDHTRFPLEVWGYVELSSAWQAETPDQSAPYSRSSLTVLVSCP